MRSSIVLITLVAALATANPLRNVLVKKAHVTDIVTKTVYVTVTAGQPLPTAPKLPKAPKTQKTTVVAHTTLTSSSIPRPSDLGPPPPLTPPIPVPASSSIPRPSDLGPPPPLTPPIPVPASSSIARPSDLGPPPPLTPPIPVPVATTAPVVQKAPPPPPAPAPAPSDYVSTALYHHNVHRANHSAGAVTWDSTLAGYAAKTAATCVFAHDISEGIGGYGQNIAAYGNSDTSKLSQTNAVASSITNLWYYGEAAYVPYGINAPPIVGPQFLHFTQVVWKATTRIGCATAQCPSKSIYSMTSMFTVCNYGSPGNYMGQFNAQVGRPIGLAGISAIAD